jgi:hypothetical protein
MTPELKELLARLEALVKRRLELLRSLAAMNATAHDTPTVEELERWYELQSD